MLFDWARFAVTLICNLSSSDLCLNIFLADALEDVWTQKIDAIQRMFVYMLEQSWIMANFF